MDFEQFEWLINIFLLIAFGILTIIICLKHASLLIALLGLVITTTIFIKTIYDLYHMEKE